MRVITRFYCSWTPPLQTVRKHKNARDVCKWHFLLDSGNPVCGSPIFALFARLIYLELFQNWELFILADKTRGSNWVQIKMRFVFKVCIGARWWSPTPITFTILRAIIFFAALLAHRFVTGGAEHKLPLLRVGKTEFFCFLSVLHDCLITPGSGTIAMTLLLPFSL